MNDGSLFSSSPSSFSSSTSFASSTFSSSFSSPACSSFSTSPSHTPLPLLFLVAKILFKSGSGRRIALAWD